MNAEHKNYLIYHVAIIKDRKYKVLDQKTVHHDLKPFLKYIIKNCKDDCMKSFKYEDLFCFNVIADGSFIFLCITKAEFKVATAFQMLQEMRTYLKSTFPTYV